MSHPKWAYCLECPEGRIFNSDEIPDGWVDNPSKIETPKKKVTTKKAVNPVINKVIKKKVTKKVVKKLS